jgi:hypothetical protein
MTGKESTLEQYELTTDSQALALNQALVDELKR